MLRVPFFSVFLWCDERCTLFFCFFNCKWQNVCIDRLSGRHGVVSLCSGSLLFLLKFEIWFIQYLRIRFDVTQSTSCIFFFSFEIQITNNQLIFSKRIISTKPIAFETKHSISHHNSCHYTFHPLHISNRYIHIKQHLFVPIILNYFWFEFYLLMRCSIIS